MMESEEGPCESDSQGLFTMDKAFKIMFAWTTASRRVWNVSCVNE